MIRDLPEGQTQFDEDAELRGQVIRLVEELRQCCAENIVLRAPLLEKIAELEKDAARYRWLRQHDVDSYFACGSMEKLDAEIDTARATE